MQGVSLVIVQQEVKYAATWLLFLMRPLLGIKIAFWGHGRNFQSRNHNSVSECFKKLLSARADWWFAYNHLSARVVERLGYPSERITRVMNSTDTQLLISEKSRYNLADLAMLKQAQGINSENIAIYTGGLYPDKRLPFLLESCTMVRESIPDFHLLVIGKGPEEDLIRDAVRQCSWIHFLGTKDDAAKVPYWLISKVSLMPGLVGLGIVDSFALGVPVITTSYPYHSPEIDYLVPGHNGLLVDEWESSAAYADAVIGLLRDDHKRVAMAAAALDSASQYSSEAMAANFAEGIIQALSVPKYKM
jgi:glycosyltransferase involved in cell wall biosynthesis